MIEDAILAAVKNITPWQMVLADQNGPRPKDRHATVKIQAMMSAHFPEIKVGATPEQDHVTVQQSFMVEVVFHGRDCFTEAAWANSRLGTSLVQDDFQRNRLSLGRPLGYRNLTFAFAGAQKEERALLEFEVFAGVRVPDNFGQIDTVEIEGKYEGTGAPGPDGDYSINTQFTVTKP